MEKVIYKFPLEVEDVQKVSMPKDAVLLTVQVQREMPCIWAIVDPGAELVQRTFIMKGTGHTFDDADLVGAMYVGTVQLRNGTLVLHVFEEELDHEEEG